MQSAGAARPAVPAAAAAAAIAAAVAVGVAVVDGDVGERHGRAARLVDSSALCRSVGVLAARTAGSTLAARTRCTVSAIRRRTGGAGDPGRAGGTVDAVGWRGPAGGHALGEPDMGQRQRSALDVEDPVETLAAEGHTEPGGVEADRGRHIELRHVDDSGAVKQVAPAVRDGGLDGGCGACQCRRSSTWGDTAPATAPRPDSNASARNAEPAATANRPRVLPSVIAKRHRLTAHFASPVA